MLSGNRIILRDWTANDIETLLALRNDVELQKLLMTNPKPNSREQVIKWASDKSERQDGVFFVVAESNSGKAIGYIQMVDMDILHGRGYLGICLARGTQGKGYGYEALCLLEDHLRATLHLRKIMLYVLATNESAIKFYQRAGFAKVGHLHEHFCLDGTFYDVLIMEKFLPR